MMAVPPSQRSWDTQVRSEQRGVVELCEVADQVEGDPTNVAPDI